MSCQSGHHSDSVATPRPRLSQSTSDIPACCAVSPHTKQLPSSPLSSRSQSPPLDDIREDQSPQLNPSGLSKSSSSNGHAYSPSLSVSSRNYSPIYSNRNLSPLYHSSGYQSPCHNSRKSPSLNHSNSNQSPPLYNSSRNKSPPVNYSNRNQSSPLYHSSRNQSSTLSYSRRNQSPPLNNSSRNQSPPLYHSSRNQLPPVNYSNRNQSYPLYPSIRNQSPPLSYSSRNQSPPLYHSSRNQSPPVNYRDRNQSSPLYHSSRNQSPPPNYSSRNHSPPLYHKSRNQSPPVNYSNRNQSSPLYHSSRNRSPVRTPVSHRSCCQLSYHSSLSRSPPRNNSGRIESPERSRESPPLGVATPRRSPALYRFAPRSTNHHTLRASVHTPPLSQNKNDPQSVTGPQGLRNVCNSNFRPRSARSTEDIASSRPTSSPQNPRQQGADNSLTLTAVNRLTRSTHDISGPRVWAPPSNESACHNVPRGVALKLRQRSRIPTLIPRQQAVKDDTATAKFSQNTESTSSKCSKTLSPPLSQRTVRSNVSRSSQDLSRSGAHTHIQLNQQINKTKNNLDGPRSPSVPSQLSQGSLKILARLKTPRLCQSILDISKSSDVPLPLSHRGQKTSRLTQSSLDISRSCVVKPPLSQRSQSKISNLSQSSVDISRSCAVKPSLRHRKQKVSSLSQSNIEISRSFAVTTPLSQKSHRNNWTLSQSSLDISRSCSPTTPLSQRSQKISRLSQSSIDISRSCSVTPTLSQRSHSKTTCGLSHSSVDVYRSCSSTPPLRQRSQKKNSRLSQSSFDVSRIDVDSERLSQSVPTSPYLRACGCAYRFVPQRTTTLVRERRRSQGRPRSTSSSAASSWRSSTRSLNRSPAWSVWSNGMDRKREELNDHVTEETPTEVGQTQSCVVQRRFESGCYLEPRPVPVRFSSSVFLNVGSTRRKFLEQIKFQTRLVPRRFSEGASTTRSEATPLFRSSVTIPCVPPPCFVLTLDNHEPLNNGNGLMEEYL